MPARRRENLPQFPFPMHRVVTALLRSGAKSRTTSVYRLQLRSLALLAALVLRLVFPMG